MTDWLEATFARDQADGIDPANAEQGWRQNDTEIVLVAGPPGAGKSTYVQTHRLPGDVVVDYDLIAEAFGTPAHQDTVCPAATVARGAVLTALRKGRLDVGRVWVVSANPNAELLFPAHQTVLVDPGRDEVLARCRKAGRPTRWFQLVDDWYRQRKVTS